ncbi:uncharacterized protein LOC142295784 isoform X2 [Anomaloglossus baeobatrachus]
MMGPSILTVLCLWSCVLTVTPLNTQEFARATDYIERNIFNDMTRQYAYFVKFNEDECNKGLQSQDIANALTVDVAAGIRATVMKREIYHGDRMVAACAIKQGKRYKHSEYRLLNIPAGSTESPISSLLKKDPAAGCVVFYSLNSPCVEFCTDPDGPYNIIDKLNQVNLPPYNSRAFAYTKVFDTDKERPRADVWKNWKALNAKMQLIRCTGNNCIQCLDNSDVKNEQCLD